LLGGPAGMPEPSKILSCGAWRACPVVWLVAGDRWTTGPSAPVGRSGWRHFLSM